MSGTCISDNDGPCDDPLPTGTSGIIGDLRIMNGDTGYGLIEDSQSPYDHDEVSMTDTLNVAYTSLQVDETHGDILFYPFEIHTPRIGSPDTIRYLFQFRAEDGGGQKDVDTVDFAFKLVPIDCGMDDYEWVKFYYNGVLQFEDEQPSFVKLFKR